MEFPNTNNPTIPDTHTTKFLKKKSEGLYEVVSYDTNQAPPGTELISLTPDGNGDGVANRTITDILGNRMTSENIGLMAICMGIMASNDISTRAIVLGVLAGVITTALFALSGGHMNSLLDVGFKTTFFLIFAGSLAKANDFLSRESNPST